MKTILLIAIPVVLLAVAAVALFTRSLGGVAEANADEQSASFYEFETRGLAGEPVALAEYGGQVALVVNVASKCGLTPQYAGLESLYRELAPQGFVVLGFPSNDFMNQEPGTAAEIRRFCTTEYQVTFPLFEKMQVKGDDRSEIYRFLTASLDEPNWNFTKYLVDREGHVVARFGPRTKPDDAELRARIEALLDAAPRD